MAQIFTDFTDNPGLIERWNTASYAATVETSGLPSGATGGAAMRIVLEGSQARYAVTPDVFGVYSGDVEVVAKLQVAHNNAGLSNAFGVVLHGGGGAGSEDAYGFVLLTMSIDSKALIEYDGGGTTIQHAADSTFAYTFSTWYRMRLQRVGTTLRARMWADGSPEPDTWLVTATDSTHSSGWPGIWCVASAGTVWCDFIGVGTDGDPAPMEPVGEPQELAGTAAAASDAEAALTLGLNLSGAAAATSDAEAALTLGLNLSGAAAGASAVDDATLTLGLNLSGSAAGVSAASGTLIASGIKSLSGAASGVSDASATLTLGLNLSGSVAGASDASATLTWGMNLSGSVAGASDASANLWLNVARKLPPAVLSDSSTRYTLVDSGVHHVLRRVR